MAFLMEEVHLHWQFSSFSVVQEVSNSSKNTNDSVCTALECCDTTPKNDGSLNVLRYSYIYVSQYKVIYIPLC